METYPRPLRPHWLRFVAEYLAEEPRNATQAYGRSHPHTKRPNWGSCASALMSNPLIQAEIKRREADMYANLEMTAQEIAKDLALISKADPRELTAWHVGACRYCYGDGFRYQRTPAEYETATREYIEKHEKDDPLGMMFDPQGGVGYNPNLEPHPDCPECFGFGVGRPVIHDTRDLSPSAARLYAGIKQTNSGIEIKTRSQEKAIELAGQRVGMFKQFVELTGRNGQPLVPSAATLTDEQLAAIVAAEQK